jgi:WD40 repeat protein
VFALAAAVASRSGVVAQTPPSAEPDFARDVVPVLEAHCLRCHSAALQEGGLILETHEDIMKGGEEGAILVAGNSAESRMIQMVEGRAKKKMPPKSDLPRDDVQVLRKWIDAGAKYSEINVSLDDRIPALKPEQMRAPSVTGLAFDPRGESLAVSGYKELRLIPVNMASGSGFSRTNTVRLKADATTTSLTGPRDLVRAVAFSPDGNWLAAVGGIPGAFGEILLWKRAAAGFELAHTVKGHRDYIIQLAFSRSGKTLATTSYDRLVRLWDVESGRAVDVLKEHTEAVYGVAFSPDDKWLASGSADRSVKIWDIESGKRLYTLTDATDAISTVAFHPKERRVTASGADRMIRTWELTAQAGRPVGSIPAHEEGVLQIAYAPDGRTLASAAMDGSVKMWDMTRGAEMRLLEAGDDWVQSLAWSPDGQRLAVGHHDGSITVYDATTGKRIWSAGRGFSPAGTPKGVPRTYSPKATEP